MLAILILLLLTHSVYSTQTESTGFMCSGSQMSLQCPRSDNIFVFLKSEDRVNRDECVSNEAAVNSDCSTTRLSDSYIQQSCPFDFTKSGLTTCKFDLKSNTYSRQSTNCSSFTANYRNIYYKCLPTPDVQVRPDVKFYDICESGEAVSKADSGFIQTPGYPEYYGNNRDCGVTFRAPQEGEKLYVYLIRLSIENNFNNDYVAVYDSKDKQLGRVTGFRGFPSLMHSVSSTNERIQLRFKSDWITTVALSRPKGMLVYFEYLNDPIPTQPPATVTSTSTETTSISSTTDESSTETSSSTDASSSTSEPETTTTTMIESTTTELTTPEATTTEPEVITSTDEPESSKIVQPNNKQNIYIISSCIFLLLAILVTVAALIAHKKRKVYDLFRINYKKAPITNSGHSTDENDIIQTILVEDTDEAGSVKSDQPRENYFNQKLRKLYQEMDKTMQLSKSILSRRSTLLSSRSNEPAATLPRSDLESGVAGGATTSSSSAIRIYKGDSQHDTSDSTHQFSEQEENECGIRDEDSSSNTSSNHN